jgi:phosphatidylglycerol:prolipoprotein diacylglycerol transferase
MLPPLYIGAWKFNTFGPLVALGVLFGLHLIHWWCTRLGLDWARLSNALLWVVLIGFVVAHVGEIAAYSPGDLFNPRKLFNMRGGLSSFGGFLGGAVTAIWFLRAMQLPIRPHVDAVLYGLTGGWLFGRLACFSVHDHPGWHTTSPLGVLIRGDMRHDLGLYELALTVVIFVYITLAIRRRQRTDGFVVAVVSCSYAIGRFALDFMRIGDTTYAGLTPAQWACFLLLGLGIEAARHVWRQPAPTPAKRRLGTYISIIMAFVLHRG